MVTKIVNPVLNLLSPAVDGALFADVLDMGGNTIEGLPLTPTENDHAASKFYVDQVASTSGGGVFLPAGFGPVPWAGTSSVPSGWLLCDGEQYDPSVYPDLFSAIGFTYNLGGENPGWFRVPDMRGRVPSGMDDMGTEYSSTRGPAGNITSATADALGGAMGVEQHTLTISELPSHNHPDTFSVGGTGTHTHQTVASSSHTHTGTTNISPTINTPASGIPTINVSGELHTHTFTTGGPSGSTAISGGSHSHTIDGSVGNQGSDQSHQNVQPTRFFGYIIKSNDSTLSFPGDIDMDGNRIINLADPTSAQDAATKNYVDSQVEASSSYDIALFVGGKVTSAGKEVARFPVVRSFTIASGFGNSQASCRVAPTGGSAVFEIRKQGSGVFGTVTFATSSTTGVFAVTTSIPSFSTGDVLRVTAQTADPSQEDIGITIEATL